MGAPRSPASPRASEPRSSEPETGEPVASRPHAGGPHAIPADSSPQEWTCLDRELLLPSRSRRVCLTCHFFRHHPGPDEIPLLTCHRHQGLIVQGEHLTHRCRGWTENLHRQRGWAPEVA